MKRILCIAAAVCLGIYANAQQKASEVRACALEVDYIEPAHYVTQEEVKKTILHPPAPEEQYLIFAYYHAAKEKNAPDSLLEELAFNGAAFYKQLAVAQKDGAFNWTAEILGWQVENALHKLQEGKYVHIWDEWNHFASI